MKIIQTLAVPICLLWAMSWPLQAELSLQIADAQLSGQKVVLKFDVSHQYPDSVQSVRALALLFDDEGKLVGRKTEWIYGGKGDMALPRDQGHRAFMVVTSEGRPVRASVQVLRVVMGPEKVVYPKAGAVEGIIRVPSADQKKERYLK